MASAREMARLAIEAARNGTERRRYAHLVRARLRGRGKRRELRALIAERRPVVLVGLIEHLGDIVAAEPVARHLRREMPDALIAWCVRPAYRELVAHHPAIDRVIEVGCLSEWMALVPQSLVDRVVDMHIDGRDCQICRIPTRRDTRGHGISLRNYYAEGNLLRAFCLSAGLPVLDDAPRVHIPAGVERRIDALKLPKRFIAVHCTSNQESRDWTSPKWAELARRIHPGEGVTVVEIGLRPVLPQGTPGCLDLTGRLSILETAEVIRRARLFVGVDSGPAHLANAVGTPGVILLGHYGAYTRYMPYSGAYQQGGAATVLHADGPAASLPVDEVAAAVGARLASTPRRSIAFSSS